MNKTIKFLFLALYLAIVSAVVSCKDDEKIIIPDDPDDTLDIPTLDDGVYVVGSAIEGDTTEVNLMVEANVGAPDFQTQPRPGLHSKYVHVKNGTISFVVVDDGEVTTYGGSSEDMETGSGMAYSLGTVTSGGAAGEIAGLETDGILAQVVFDISTLQYVVIPVQYWQIIGSATEGGWSTGAEIALKSSSASEVVYEGTKVVLRGPNTEFKFRVNDNWNLDLDSEECDDSVEPCLNFNTNFGGTLTEFVEGGSNMAFVGGEGIDGEYTVTVTYTPGEGNSLAFSIVRTGDVEPLPEYPAELYAVGGTLGGWDWAANGIQMIPVHSQPHLFWRILWMDVTNAEGFKFAPQKEWVGDFGKTGDATNGVYARGSDNVPAPATTGYYMVVVNLATNTIEVTEPKVYGIGDAFGGWTKDTYAFTVDNTNQVITFDGIVAASDLRMHVNASTMVKSENSSDFDWWQAEFVILDGQIAYRGTGGDQTRVPVTVGQDISLNFKEGTGSIQ